MYFIFMQSQTLSVNYEVDSQNYSIHKFQKSVFFNISIYYQGNLAEQIRLFFSMVLL